MGNDKKLIPGIDPTLVLLLFAVNDSLDIYVDMHNKIFKFSWRKIIPIPGFFLKIDFKMFANKLSRVHSGIQVCRSEMDVLGPLLDNRNRIVLSVLVKFSDALGDTVSRLSEICLQLWYKSNKPDSYSYVTYDAAYKRYESSVLEYVRVGEELNRVCQAK